MIRATLLSCRCFAGEVCLLNKMNSIVFLALRCGAGAKDIFKIPFDCASWTMLCWKAVPLMPANTGPRVELIFNQIQCNLQDHVGKQDGFPSASANIRENL